MTSSALQTYLDAKKALAELAAAASSEVSAPLCTRCGLPCIDDRPGHTPGACYSTMTERPGVYCYKCSPLLR